MNNPERSIANEFDSYLRDRARRAGWRLAASAPGDACGAGELAGGARLALVAFQGLPGGADAAPFSPAGMQALRGHCHFVAWAETPGALVQVRRHDGVDSVGARAFAEAFFAAGHEMSLAPDAFQAYLDCLAEGVNGGAFPLALLVTHGALREAALVPLPSVAAARGWLRARAARPPAP